MGITPSSRSDIAPFRVMEVFDAAERRAATGAEVVRLEVGQPLTPAPKGVIERAHQVLDTCLLYTSPSPRDATLSRMPSSA